MFHIYEIKIQNSFISNIGRSQQQIFDTSMAFVEDPLVNILKTDLSYKHGISRRSGQHFTFLTNIQQFSAQLGLYDKSIQILLLNQKFLKAHWCINF